ncbi:MAG: hypothetical protein QM808_11485 [Steroidobacteraceae bacterium]
MSKASGGCHCGNIKIDLDLSVDVFTYHPRACDCDFCRMHGAAWLSDAQGSMRVRIKDSNERGAYRQGSGQAEFMLCRTCGVLVCVMHRVGEQLHAAVNTKVLSGIEFGVEQAASPKKLSAQEKAQRWQDLWFADVRITESG